jgi:HK97 family phage major capsid protein
MESIKLKEDRAVLVENMETIFNAAKSESRDLTEDESKTWEGFNTEIEALDKKIEMAERQEDLNKSIAANISATKSSNNNKKEFKKYSFLKAVNEFANGKLTGLEAEMDQEAKRNNSGIVGLGVPTEMFGMEKRTNPQTTADADEFIPTNVGDFVGTLQAKTVLGGLATWMSGLSGNVKLPVLSDTTAGWVGETASATDAATAVAGPTLSPERLSSYMDISKQLLIQTNDSIERAIRDDMMGAIAAKVESAVLGESDGTANEPQGVFNAGTNVGAAATLSRTELLKFEKALADANSDFGRMAWIVNPEGREQLRNLANDIIATSGASTPLWNNNQLIGYDAFCTTNVIATLGSGNDENGIVLGRWDDCVIGQFGNALDVLVDPYTKAKEGQIRIVINSYWDTAWRRATSFQYGSFATS